MRCVVLQPSFIPWRGYFDLIQKSDVFVFYDDVQYDRHGWRNRNRIKTPNGTQWLTIPVRSRGHLADQRTIREIEIDWNRPWNQTHWATLQQSYRRAPHFERYAPLVQSFYGLGPEAQERPQRLADFTIATTISLARSLGIDHTRFLRSSELSVPTTVGDVARLGGTERLVAVLKAVGATHYITGPSARDYLDEAQLAAIGVSLEYMVYNYPEYLQLHPPYDPAVSILDLIFMTGPAARAHICAKG